MSTTNIQTEEIDWDKEIADYEQKCAVICKYNASYLQLFEADLRGLAPKTIKRHQQNIDFFLNTYLLFDETHPLTIGRRHNCN